jgi:hypothetical protein
VAVALGALLWLAAMLAAAPPAGAVLDAGTSSVAVHQVKATTSAVPTAPQRFRALVGVVPAQLLVVASTAIAAVAVALASARGRSVAGRVPARAPPG